MAFLNPGQLGALLWAQSRILLNGRSRASGRSFPLGLIFGAIWYSIWLCAAVLVGLAVADPENLAFVRERLGVGLFGIFLYWQIVPIVMVSAGFSLELGRLSVYPIPQRQLFIIQLVLRATTAVEMLLITSGLLCGLLLNPDIPGYASLALLPFVGTNLMLSAGLRDLVARLFERKGVRELLIVGLVLLSALPQVSLSVSLPAGLRRALHTVFLGPFWPWSAAAAIVTGRTEAGVVAASFVWVGVAYYFSRQQFEKTLRFDSAEARGSATAIRRFEWINMLAQCIGSRLPDPMAALVEKDIRTLGRSARFRLLFLMGFSFGLVIWLPMIIRSDSESALRSNYLAIVSAYALMLLGDVLFWNSLGMDRAAAGIYFIAPTSLATVLAAKNLAALVFVSLEIFCIVLLCAVLGMPVSLRTASEAVSVTAVLTLFLMSTGNLMSTRFPRPVDPAKSWRTGATGSAQMFLLLLYPLVSAPVVLAYAARYAFDTQLAFYGVLLFDLFVGAAVYWVSLGSAAQSAQAQKEGLVFALSQNQGPVSS